MRGVTLLVIALLCLVASSALAQPAVTEQLTLDVRPRLTRWGEELLAVGNLGSGRADQKVTLQFKQCGLYPQGFRDVAEATTREGGSWYVDWVDGRGSGVYRAISGDAISNEVNVQGRPSMLLSRRAANRWAIFVTAGLPFYKKRVLIERFDARRQAWVAVRTVLLTKQMVNNPAYGLPYVTTYSEEFVPGVQRWQSIRATLPLKDAKPCYLGGYSNIVRS